MDIMFLLLGVSLLIALVFLVIFIATVRSGQYDDMYTPSVRMLFEEENVTDNSTSEINQSNPPKNN